MTIFHSRKIGGILLKDILEEEVDEKYFLSDKMIECLKGRVKTGNDPTCVAMTACLTPKRTEYGKKIRKEYEAGIVKEQIKNIQRLEPREDGKINCLTTVQKNNLIIVSGTIRTFGGKHFREIKSGKSCTLMARARNDGNSQPCVQIGARIRRLTPTECARLQTIPEWYIWDGISDTQRYKMLGNGWNIETIKHIFKYLRR